MKMEKADGALVLDDVVQRCSFVQIILCITVGATASVLCDSQCEGASFVVDFSSHCNEEFVLDVLVESSSVLFRIPES